MFKVGDEVEVISNAYGITTRGSKGTIIKTLPYEIVVIHFTYLESNEYGQHDYGYPDDTYTISKSDVRLVTPVNPQLAVINKIKEMEARRIKLTKAKGGYAKAFTTDL